MAKTKARRRKSRKRKSPLIRIFAVAAVIIAVWFVLSKASFQCDHCGLLTFGGGYKPNALIEAFGKEERICEDCAREEHKEALALKLNTLLDFKLEIDWFGKGTEETTKKGS